MNNTNKSNLPSCIYLVVCNTIGCSVEARDKKRASEIIWLRSDYQTQTTEAESFPSACQLSYRQLYPCCTVISTLSPGSGRSSDYTPLQLLAICGTLLEAFSWQEMIPARHQSIQKILDGTAGMMSCWWSPFAMWLNCCISGHTAVQRLQRMQCSQKVTRLIPAAADVSVKSWGSTVRTIKLYALGHSESANCFNVRRLL